VPRRLGALISYLSWIGVPKRKRRGTQEAKGEVCKTSIRRFESDPRLHHILSEAAFKLIALSLETLIFVGERRAGIKIDVFVDIEN
jgi:hypothetical protein